MSKMDFSANTAINTILTLAMTKLIEGVRNLLYSGSLLKRNSLNPIKFLPQDMRIARIVAANSHHLSGPFTTNKPKTNKNTMIAPKSSQLSP